MSTDESTGKRELLRLATAGSVDDGKSTLIGRLLFDTGALMSDHLDDASGDRGHLDLAAITDGLRAEREQGITIDVAYRFFATERRSFILADTPGHERYTRNMFTGASTADVAVVLIDARQGVVRQTRRHVNIAALLGIEHVVACVNKMDLVDWEPGPSRRSRPVHDLARRLGIPDLLVVPISALLGDNVAFAPGRRRSMTARRCLSTSRSSTSRPIATSSACDSRSSGWAVRPTATRDCTPDGSLRARSEQATRWLFCRQASRPPLSTWTHLIGRRRRRCPRCR